jgi:hypothetical protein
VIIDINTIIIKEETNYIWFDISKPQVIFILKTKEWNCGSFQFYKLNDYTVLSCTDDKIELIDIKMKSINFTFILPS